jgi:hypothetical protein
MGSRDMRVAFKISEHKHKELKGMADDYGVTMSALVALVMGQWLHQQNQVMKPMIETMRKVVEEEMKSTLKATQ